MRAGFGEDGPGVGETESALHDGGSVPGVPPGLLCMTALRSGDPENSVYAFNFSISRLFPPSLRPHLLLYPCAP